MFELLKLPLVLVSVSGRAVQANSKLAAASFFYFLFFIFKLSFIFHLDAPQMCTHGENRLSHFRFCPFKWKSLYYFLKKCIYLIVIQTDNPHYKQHMDRGGMFLYARFYFTVSSFETRRFSTVVGGFNAVDLIGVMKC